MATQDAKRRCPLCGLREEAAVSDESRRRDVSGDTWTLTPLGVATLAAQRRAPGLALRLTRAAYEQRREREAASMRRYHDEMETPA
jgi:hypothetical protein